MSNKTSNKALMHQQNVPLQITPQHLVRAFRFEHHLKVQTVLGNTIKARVVSASTCKEK